ncbi:MAG: hypothetical protein ABR589_00045 [Chthoniobacterales bacterium]
MKDAPLFLTEETVVEYHSEQIKLFGGLEGLRVPALLESALAAPQNLYHYDDDAGLFDLATA